MSKKVYLIHGWDGSPEDCWLPWLKNELETKGFEVIVPQLPEAESPRIYNWVPKLAEVVGLADEDCYFVGHSMGCQTIVRYLETLPENVKVGGAVFVAGFFKRLTNLEDEDIVREIAKQWLETPIDWDKVKTHLTKSVAVFSDNDEYVPLDNQEDFKSILNSEIIVEHDKGHFNNSHKIFELPIVLEKLLDISK